MQLVVQSGCLLLFLAGGILRSNNTTELDTFDDILLSIMLIAVSLAS